MEGAESVNVPVAGVLHATATDQACTSAEAATGAVGAGGVAGAPEHAAARGSSGIAVDRVPRLTGSLSTVYLLLHIHLLPLEPQKQQQRRRQQQQHLRDVCVGSAAITRSFTAALLQHTGLVGSALLPFEVISYDSRLSLFVVKTDSASAPTLILVAAGIRSLEAASATTTITLPCFLTLVRTAASLHALACPRRPNAVLLLHGGPMTKQ